MKFILVAFVTLFASSLQAEENPRWMRNPAISPDGKKIAFTYKGDLYMVSSQGGLATALTFHEAHDFMPVWSPDGKSIAFASDRYGNFDVFIVSVDEGNAKRLTFHSSQEYPYSFSADGSAVFFGGVRQDAVLHRQYPDTAQPEVYSISANGGMVNQLWTVPAENLSVSASGKYILYHDKKGGENEWRKHHQSSVTRDVWLYTVETNAHTKLTSFKGEDRNPVFAASGKDFYFLSESSGTFNVYKQSLLDASQQQITKFKTHPVRFLSVSTSGLLCFAYDGSLFTMQEGQEPKQVEVEIRTDLKSNAEKIVSASGNVREMAIAPNGKEVAYIVRGEVFVSSVEGGVTKRITRTAEQERFLSYSPDGETLVYASERNGSWKIYQTKKVRKEEPYFYASTLLSEEVLLQEEQDNYQPLFSPDGKELAFISGKRSLKVMNLATKKVRTLLGPSELFYMGDGDQYFQWSPDSKWLLAEYSPVMANGEVVLLAADGSAKMINLSESGYADFRPKWVNDGKQMLWFSDRDGLRSYANSGRRQADVYTMFFTRKAWDRFKLSKEDFDLLKEIEEKEKEKAKGKEEEATKKSDKKKSSEVKKEELIAFDMEGVRDRKVKLTIHSSSLSDAVLSKDGESLFYLARFEKGLNLWSTNLRTQETKMEVGLDASSGSLIWDKDKKNLFLLADGRISKINPEGWKKTSVELGGELSFNVSAERTHMFQHVWQRAKTGFYTSTYHGAAWDQMRIDYEKFLPHIATGYEFSELLSELLGELNVSHSGSRFRQGSSSDDRTASLGVLMDYAYKGDGIKIAEILRNGPLDKASISLKPGMVIEQVDGESLSSLRDVASYLNRKAGKFTQLNVFDPVTNTRQQLTIKPISLDEEADLLYLRWVKKNQQEVDKLSNGQLGYVHIPGMSDGPYRSIYEEMMGKYHDKKGVIIDTRFNGGGDLVADLATFFTGKKFLDYAIESRSVGYEPGFRWTKPTLAMFNEDNYSDGHCFACGYQDLNIGRTVGMPVPGTCSFASWELLQDGVTVWGMVPVSAKNSKGEWLENLETVPDVQVKNEPGIIAQGRDQQLEKAVEELLKLTK